MALRKIWGILALIMLVGTAVASVKFEVGVDPRADTTVRDVMYENRTDVIHDASAVVENTASVGCVYSLQNTLEADNLTKTVRSGGYAIWPGETSTLEIYSIPENYTGEIEADLDLVFCGKTRNVTEYSFNVTERTKIDSSVESQTLEANSTRVSVEIDAESGSLIPIETPGYWKVSRTEIKNGKADLSYLAPLYKPDEIEYAVLGSNESIIGKTTVDTTPPEPTRWERMKEYLWIAPVGLFLISALLNLYLLRGKILPEKWLEKLSEIELEGRDIRNN